MYERHPAIIQQCIEAIPNYALLGWMQECGGGDIGDGGHLKMSFSGAYHYS
jgi:hypothetical protein